MLGGAQTRRILSWDLHARVELRAGYGTLVSTTGAHSERNGVLQNQDDTVTRPSVPCPIRPTKHDFRRRPAVFGGVMKVYNDWRFHGDTDWLRSLACQG